MYRLTHISQEAASIFMQVIAFILLYLTPISNYVHLVLILIGIDLFTGIYASMKAGQRFEGHKLQDTLEKFIFYALAIIVAYVLQRIINDGSELARIVALYIGSIEVKSIYENISRITKTDIVSMMWDLIKDKIESMVVNLKAKNKEAKDDA